MIDIDYFQLLKLYLHSAMYISEPKSKKMYYSFATPRDLWLTRGAFRRSLANQGGFQGKRSKLWRLLGEKLDLGT